MPSVNPGPSSSAQSNTQAVLAAGGVSSTASPPVIGGYRAVLMGDSITAGGQEVSTPAISNCSGSGTLGSLTISSFVVPGNTVWLSGFDQSEWNGQKVVSGNASGVVTFGNSTTLTSTPTGTPFISAESVCTNRDFFRHANGLMGLPFGSVINRAVSGTTTAIMLNNFDRDIAPLLPAVLWVMGGVNDITGAPSTAAGQATAIANALSNLRSIVDKALALGAEVLISTLLPLTASGGTGTDATATALRQQSILNLNRLIKVTFQSSKNVCVIDTHQYTSSPTTLNWLAGSSRWSSDGVHPTSYAAFTGIAKAIYDQINSMFGVTKPRLVDNSVDTWVSDNTSRQLMPDPLFQSTTNSVIAGFAGSGGAGNPVYQVDCAPSRAAGVPTANCEIVTRSDGFGNDQKLTVTLSANNDQIDCFMANTGHLTTNLAAYANRRVKFRMPMAISNVPADTVSGIDIYLRNSGFTTFMFITAQNTPNFSVSGNLIIESGEFVIPSNWTAVSSHIIFRFSGNAANAVFQFGRWSLDVID